MGSSSSGRLLHLRCFLEGIEVPVVSCSVSAVIGGPASAHIELLDSELGFELLPRTMIHVFFFDDEDGTIGVEPNLYSADDRSNSRVSSHYKLLFCGELFSIFHNKSGYGSRNLTIMALDMSNVLDTSYIFQVSYSDVGGALGTGAQAESQFVSASSITNNPFDNIINSPQEVIKNIATTTASSAKHASRVSRLGGLFSIFELLLGVEGHALGMNLWTTIHERLVRLLDMMDSDTGETAQKLFDKTIFNQWLTNSVSNQAPSMSYRELALMIMRYIYYDMVSIPTASYHTPADGTGREDYEVVKTTQSVPPSLREYFFSDSEYAQASQMSSEFLSNVVRVIDNLRDKGYTSTAITSGFRTSQEADALYGPNAFKSPHSKGIAADIDWNDIPNGEMFRLGNVALSKNRDISGIGDDLIQYLMDANYVRESKVKKSKNGKISNASITDARIIRFLLDYSPKKKDWVAAEEKLTPLLFGGHIANTYQFLHYMLVYPFMSSNTIRDRTWWLARYEKGVARYIDTWRMGFRYKNFVGLRLLSNDKSSMWRGMSPDNPAHIWLSSWISANYMTISTLLNAGNATGVATIKEKFALGPEETSLSEHTVSFNSPGGLTDLASYYVGGRKGTSMGLTHKAHIDAMNSLWHDYYEAKVSFWKDKAEAVKVVSGAQQPAMFSGANKLILSGKPYFSPPMMFVFYDKPLGSTEGVGDDPVHIQTVSSFSYSPDDSNINATKAAALYDSRERLTGFLLRPDIWMCAPPTCNVIFPEDIVSLNISRELMRQTTRTFLMTYDELYADNVIFNGHYFAPQFDNDLPSIQKKAFGVSTSNEVIYPHEVYTGIIPKVNRISEIAFYSKAVTVQDEDRQVLSDSDLDDMSSYSDNDAQMELLSAKGSGTYDYVRAYASDVAHFNLMKQRYSANRISVTARFSPMVIPGLPAVVIGQTRTGPGFSSTHTWLGMIQSVQHSYSQGGATTSISMETCRPYKTGENSIDELLKLKKAGSNLFKNQDPSFVQKFTQGVKDAPTSFTFVDRVSLQLPSTSFEQLLYKAQVRPFGWPGTPDLLNASSLHTFIYQLCESESAYSTYFAADISSTYAKNMLYNIDADRKGMIPVRLHIEYNKKGETDAFTYPFGLLPTTAYPGYVLHLTIFSSYWYKGGGDYSLSDFPYEPFNQIPFFTKKAESLAKKIADTCVEVATTVSTSMQTVVDAEAILVPVGDEYKQVTEITPSPQAEPTVGYLVFTYNNIEEADPSDVTLGSETGLLLKDASDDDLNTVITVDLTGKLMVRVPVLLATETYNVVVGDAGDAKVTGAAAKLANKFRPLEEAIMPAWLDDAYKNGAVGGSDSTISSGSATIKSESGIGALYRKWFACDAIVDGVPYSNKSEYSTVTIEESVDNLINKYSNGTLGGTYRYTKRNIATLTNMLGPIKETVTNKVPQSGGFHSRSVGDFDNLEGLGLTGIALKGSLTTDKTVTISTLSQEQKDQGLALDPRKERRKRVILYRDDVTRNRGKQG